MQRNRAWPWLLLVGSALSAFGCKSGAAAGGQGAQCVFNSDCDDDLRCSFERCHVSCAEAPCPDGDLCVVDGEGTQVCLLPEYESCERGHECPSPLVCAEDGVCRTSCSAASCPSGQLCSDEGLCVSVPSPSSGAGGTPAVGAGSTGGRSSPSTGGATGGVAEWSVDEWGHVSVCGWHGYGFAVAGPEGDSTITPDTFDGSLCAHGVIGAQDDWGGYALIGVNINQEPGEDTPNPSVEPRGDGIAIRVSNPGATELRLQIQDELGPESAEHRWCAVVSGTTDLVPWSEFNTECWSDTSGRDYEGQPINAVIVIVPGHNRHDTEYDFCIENLAPWGTACVGSAGSGGAPSTGGGPATGGGRTGGSETGGLPAIGGFPPIGGLPTIGGFPPIGGLSLAGFPSMGGVPIGGFPPIGGLFPPTGGLPLPGGTSPTAGAGAGGASGGAPTAGAPPTGGVIDTGCEDDEGYFCEDFESGTSRWQLSGQDWAVDETTSQSGSACLTDSPGGDYPRDADASATLARGVRLAAATDPILQFWHRLDIAVSDYAYVEVSLDYGLSWEPLGTFEDDDNTSTWSLQRLDLSAYAGEEVAFRFRLWDDDYSSSYVGDGWYLDDIRVMKPPGVMVGAGPDGCRAATTTRYFCDGFEAGLDTWLTSWSVTTTEPQSGAHSLTDSPDGDYERDADASLMLSRPIELSGTTTPQLRFWHRLDLAVSDYAYVEASLDHGMTWDVVRRFEDDDSTSTWSLQVLDLSEYSGSSVTLRFRVWDDDYSASYVGDGWTLDDVEIAEPAEPRSGTGPESCPEATTTRYFCDSFETGLEAWQTSWETTESVARTGAAAISDSPDGTYPRDADAGLTMQWPVDLRDATTPVLRFWHQLDVAVSDYAYVEVSADGGLTWTLLHRFEDDDNASTWSLQQLSLEDYAGEVVLVRFRLWDDDYSASYVGDGWSLDDVEIAELR